jgi:hypothetical protein
MLSGPGTRPGSDVRLGDVAASQSSHPALGVHGPNP